MMCYLDKTFCPSGKSCMNGHKCDRVLTEKVIEGAKKWWGASEPPISVFAKTPDCYLPYFEIK